MVEAASAASAAASRIPAATHRPSRRTALAGLVRPHGRAHACGHCARRSRRSCARGWARRSAPER
eukprot:1109190-Prymnesium_polylepis.1